MIIHQSRLRLLVCVGLSLSPVAGSAIAATPTAEQALKITPIQKDVEYDVPEAPAKCTIKAESLGEKGKGKGWVVRDPAGQVVRNFLDTNGDNVVDQWCYFKDGVEVYRDIASATSKGKADQYRWLGTAGSRWGLDSNNDGKIDAWKTISAEEVTSEVVAALRDGDVDRFRRLLLTAEELKELGVGSTKGKELTEKLRRATGAFQALLKSQKAIGRDTKWVYFGGSRPGLVPAGTEGSTADILVYENVAAMVETKGEHGQINVGTLVRVQDSWRLIDAPRIATDESVADVAPFFFPDPNKNHSRPETAGTEGPNSEEQRLMKDLDEVYTAIGTAPPEKLEALNLRRTKVLEDLAKLPPPTDRGQWIHQLADTISTSVQSDSYPGGVAKLKSLVAQLENDGDKELTEYMLFRMLQADNAEAIRDAEKNGGNFDEVNKKWLVTLEDFVKNHPTSPDCADAMQQLALTLEFDGGDPKTSEKALGWYTRIVKDFPKSSAYKKALGAKTRLESVGRTISLKGKSIDNQLYDLAKHQGKAVLIYYWASDVQPSTSNLALLQGLQARYASKGFEIVGVSLDQNKEALTGYLLEQPLAWPQIYEEGGMDSRLANEMGILTIPTLILVDPSGKVKSNNVAISELDGTLRELLLKANDNANAKPNKKDGKATR